MRIIKYSILLIVLFVAGCASLYQDKYCEECPVYADLQKSKTG